MRVLAIALALASCTAPQPPASTPPPPPPPAPPADAKPAEPEALAPTGCAVVVQPSAPGHTSVEPEDMICTHGDSALECAAGFDGEARHCYHAIGGKVARARGDLAVGFAEHRLWCCPGAR
jgi:hypothetical protein